jgi:hypothetical protein
MTTPHAALVAVTGVGLDDLRLSRLEALLDPVFLSEAGSGQSRADDSAQHPADLTLGRNGDPSILSHYVSCLPESAGRRGSLQ